MQTKFNIEKLYHLAIEGGFTYDYLFDRLDTVGFAVSEYKPLEVRIPQDEFKPSDIRDYMVNNQQVIFDNPRARFGAWLDNETGCIVLDMSNVYYSKELAIKKGIENDQDAIFDLSKGEEIRLKGE